MRLAITRNQVTINRPSWLLWTAITLLFLYERTYLIQKAGLPHLVECVIVRVGLLLLLCSIHNEWLSRLLSRKKYGLYVIFTALSIGIYLLLQGAYDQYLFGFVIGDQERANLWSNLPYNLIVTGWYVLLTYLVKRAVNAPGNVPKPARTVADQVLTIKTGTQWVRVSIAEILYAQGLKDYTILYTRYEKHIMKGSIGTVANTLPDGLFMRVHKSYLVAKQHIKSVSSTEVVLDGQTIPVGRAYAKDVQKAFVHGYQNDGNCTEPTGQSGLFTNH